MTEPTSVRPELLEQFARTSQRIETHLDSRISAARRAVNAFLAATDAGLATSQPDLMDAGLTDISSRLSDTRRFATLLRQAVLAADVHGAGGAVTVSHAQLLAGLSDSARREFEALLNPDPLPTIDPPDVGTIPEDSGLVDDPVCTATGHFLEDEVDLVVPDRVAALGWPRRYSSRQLDVNGHGPGWWTWADVTWRLDGDVVVLVCPDGRHLRFARPADGAVVGAEHDDVTLEPRPAGGFVVRWGLRHRAGPQTWELDADGRLLRIEDALRGRIACDHDDLGRLVAMTHDGGRSLRIEWDDERIVAIHDPHGRSARYRYVDGHLAEVERDLGGRTYAKDVHGRIVEVVDADGVTLARNRYDADGRVLRQVAPTGRVTVFRYEPGRRTAVLDGAGELVTLYVHDHRGRVEAMVSPHGAELSRSFDRAGRVVSLLAHDGSGFTSEGHAGPDGTVRITHHDGRVEQIDHDHLGRVVRHELVGAGATTFEYQGDSICPSAVTSPSGARRTMTWQDSGVLVGTVDPDGVTFEAEVDGDGLPLVATDGAGNRARVERHASGLPTRIVLPDGAELRADIDGAGRVTRLVDAGGGEARLEHSPAGRLTALVAPDGSRTEIRHGHHGFIESVVDVDGRVEHTEIDEWGRPVAIGGADGTPGWTLRWSPLGVLLEVTTPAGAHWQRDLDDHHRVHTVTDPAERTTTFHRDLTGRIDAVEGPLGTRTVSRDAAGRVVRSAGGPDGDADLRVDAEGRVIETRDADGVRTATSYSPGGRTVAVQVGDDAPTTFEHDAAGQVAAVRRPGGAWHVENDWRGAPVAITAPTGRRTTIRRDGVGRPVEVDVDGQVEHYAYDPAGRLRSLSRPTGTVASVEYDALGRVVAVDGPGGEVRFEHADGTVAVVDPLGGRSETTFDPAGRAVARTDQLGRSTAYEHTPDGRLQAVVHADGTRLGFEHDAAGRVTAVFGDGTALARYGYDGTHLHQVDEPGAGRRTTFETSPAGRLRAWDDGTGRTEVDRDTAGRVIARRGGGLPDATWTHEADGRTGEVDGRPAAVRADADGAVAAVELGEQALTVERGAGGLVQRLDLDGAAARSIVVERDGAGRVVAVESDGVRTRYGYDDADRLTSRTTDDERTQWHHDVAGRLVAEIHTVDGIEHERRFEYDAAHQLVAVHGPEGTTRLDYDGAGRRVAEHRPDGSTRRYEWDALDRLTAVVDDDRRTTVDVDCFGRLRAVGGTELRWDLSAPSPELATIGDTPVVASGRLVLAVGDDLLPASILGPAATGARPWGHAPADGSVSADCGVPGGIAFAGLVWLGDRVLDPATGQFLTPDPLVEATGSATQAFPYAYADGDPVNRMDPTGRNGQPISIEQFEKERQASMGWQWGNIATVAGVVGVTALAFVPGVNVVTFVVAGAAFGGAQAAGKAVQEGRPISGREVLIGTAFGGATALVGGVGYSALRGAVTQRAMGQMLRAPMSSYGTVPTGNLARDVARGATTSMVREGPLNALEELASNGTDYDLRSVAMRTGVSGLTGGFVDGVGSLRAPDTGPLPDLPTPSVAHSTAPTVSDVPTPSLGPAPAPAPAGPSPTIIRPSASLLLPEPPAGFERHHSGLYVPR